MTSSLKTALAVLCLAAASTGCKKEDPGQTPVEPMALVANYPVANAGEPITFHISNAVNGITGVRWNFGDGSAPENTYNISIDHTYTNVGEYTARADVFVNNETFTCTRNVKIEGQVEQRGTLTGARVTGYNNQTSLWDYEYSNSADRYPDIYLRVRVKRGNTYEVLLAKSAVKQNFAVNGSFMTFDNVPFLIDDMDLLEVSIMNDNTTESRVDNVIGSFVKTKTELVNLHSSSGGYSAFEWVSTDSYSVLDVTFAWN